MPRRIVSIAVCFLMLMSCSTLSSKRAQQSRNYTLNVEKEAIIHTPMIASENIKYVLGRRVEGVPESREYWQATEYPGKGSRREELTYKGRSGRDIHILYKREDFVWPPLYQDLTFDLEMSDIVVIRNYTIRVLEATQNSIRFIVLAD